MSLSKTLSRTLHGLIVVCSNTPMCGDSTPFSTSLRCVAVCCSVLQCPAAGCSGLQWVAVCSRMFVDSAPFSRCVAVCCSVSQRVAACCSVLQCVAECVETRRLSRQVRGSNESCHISNESCHTSHQPCLM